MRKQLKATLKREFEEMLGIESANIQRAGMSRIAKAHAFAKILMKPSALAAPMFILGFNNVLNKKYLIPAAIETVNETYPTYYVGQTFNINATLRIRI